MAGYSGCPHEWARRVVRVSGADPSQGRGVVLGSGWGGGALRVVRLVLYLRFSRAWSSVR